MDVIKQNLVKSAQIRLDLNDNLHKEAYNIRKEFKDIFKSDPKTFAELKDLKYYRGRYPTENTPPRIDTLCNKVANLLQLSEYVGDTELKDMMTSRGITITIQEPKIFNPELSYEEARDAFDWLMGRALENQKEICNQADLIKIDGYQEFVQESGEEIEKSDYILCVQNKYKELKQLDNANIIKDIDKRKTSINTVEKYI